MDIGMSTKNSLAFLTDASSAIHSAQPEVKAAHSDIIS